MSKEKIQGILAEQSGLEAMLTKTTLDEHYSEKQQLKEDAFSSKLSAFKEKMNKVESKKRGFKL